MPVHPSLTARVAVALLLLLAVAAPVGAADPAGRPQPRSLQMQASRNRASVAGELIVRFAAHSSAAARSRAVDAAGARVKQRLRAPNTVVLRLPASSNPSAAAAILERRPGVEYAEPNFVYRTFATPDDPRFSDLWGLHSGTDHDIDAPEAWNVTTGSPDVLVAVVDTGVDASHPDLAENIWTNPGESDDGIDNDANGLVDDLHGWDFVAEDNDPDDANGHGTHVAGTIGASGNNGQGMTGVAWDVSLLPLRAGNASAVLTSANVADAFDYACEMGAQVVNGSFGGGSQSQAVRDAIIACPQALFVVAAGNSANDNDVDPVYPCSFGQTNIVCVAASGRGDRLADFSNFGDTSVDVAAPGESVLSATPRQVLFADGFESGLGRWQKVTPRGIAWATTPSVSHSGSRSATDSKDGLYANRSNTWIETANSIDLSGGDACELDYALRIDTQPGADWLFVEGSDDGWLTKEFIDGDPSGDFAWTGSSQGEFLDVPNLLANDGFHSPSSFDFRFRLTSNASVRRNGAFVDDVAVHCLTGAHGPDDFVRFSGTSMATPHVAGAAALLLSEYPAATVAELKAALLSGTDRLASLDGKVLSGGRLNARGALDALDVVRPVASPPSQRLSRSAPAGVDDVRMRVAWNAATDVDPSSGIDRYQLQVRRKVGSTWRSWNGVRTTDGLVVVTDVAPGTHQFRVRAIDGAGNKSSYKVGSRFTLADPQGGTAIDFVGSWRTQTSTDFFDGSTRHSSVIGASATHAFTGRQVAWLASRGPNRGRAKVFIDGVLAATVDLHAGVSRHRQIAYSTSWDVVGSHTVMVRVIAKGSLSSGSRVDVDAFITLN